ncbi:response regulator transcription factor [Streptacidiphilus sp. ASG 303]|uniref:response regulator transcription factor n=1 Tax=Streptacidiphilus sp. ASG 303 TaxID=2896847 RepID=UPI001E5E8D93|nr:response regulator transcription factor [Streptacidiphilus sp. ASG 303]MCD0486350.1 response regulator transcription factor [Streptacidiphilus sp. ASG 303]
MTQRETAVQPLGVAVRTDDPLTRDGVLTLLRACPEVEVVSPELSHTAEVLLVVVRQVTVETLLWMKAASLQSADRRLRVVLVAEGIGESQLMRAIGYGLVSFLLRPQTGFEQVLQAMIAARRGASDMPRDLVRRLVEELRAVQNGASGSGSSAGLDSREVDVLRLLAEGFDTVEIANKLNYSERTIKNIIHAVTRRLNLRNRTHAVAYGIRSGVL